jgi:hypothetical protein
MRNRPLVALSSAAIVAVYGAGYMRTRAAAERFEEPGAPRKRLSPRAQAQPDAPPVEGRLAIPAPTTPAPAIAPRTPRTTRESAPADAPAASLTPIAPAVPAAPPPTPTPGDVPSAQGFDAESIQGIAQPGIDAPPPGPQIVRGQYKDGTYTGWGYCRHGDIQASVVVEAGKIVSARVAQCRTRYSCNWIEPLYPQVVQRQNAEVDYVSGASESSDAFHDAIAEALAKAK